MFLVIFLSSSSKGLNKYFLLFFFGGWGGDWGTPLPLPPIELYPWSNNAAILRVEKAYYLNYH